VADEFVFRFPPPGPCPLPDQADVCDLALSVVRHVRNGDADAILARATPLPIRCPELPQTVLFGSVCEGQWGQAVSAIYVAKWGGAAGLDTLAQLRQAIAARLDEPAAASAVVGGVGCSLPKCELAVVAIVFPSTAGDGVLLFQVRRNASGLGIVGMLNWAPSDPFVRGQSSGLPIAFPELRAAAMALAFHPWTPQ
jgi:hypothetical protein